jgi:hypothetical protein
MSPKSSLAIAAVCAAVAGCMTPPPEIDQSLQRPTAEHRYVVALQPLTEPIAINQLHSGEIRVASPAGEPIMHARIAVDGGMPQHGHGLPTRPQVSRELGDGRYLLEGMKFSMPGWWEIKLRVEGRDGSDRVTFNKVVALAAPR